MNVAVLGAAGTVARAIVRDLAESTEIDGLLLLDRDGPAATAVADEHAAGKGRVVALAAPEGLSDAIADCQVLVNVAGHDLNLDAMEAALAAGCHYIDLGGRYRMTARQLELDERFVAADLLAALGMGASPGQTNVMAERAVRVLDEKVLEIHVSVAGRDPAPGDGLRLPHDLRTLIDELSLAPVVLVDGLPREVAPRHSGGYVTFPAPIGRAETIYTLHSELQTFGRSFEVGRASFRRSLAPELRARLEELVGAGEEELDAVASASLPPSAEAIAAHVVEARGATRVVRVSGLTRPMADWGMGGGVVSTAAPAAALVRLIARGQIDPVGALPPEDCVDPDALLPELETRGCVFEVEVAER